MALNSAANIKTQAALIATALNTALGDTVLTGIAVAIQHPSHPLRGIANLVTLSNLGVFTANDDYIDAAHAGTTGRNQPTDAKESITPDPVV